MKKRIISFLLFLTFILTLSSVCFADNNSECELTFDITFEKNLLFNKYDVDLFLDGQKIARIDHGSTHTSTHSLSVGTHTIAFYKSMDSSIQYTNQISLDRDSIYKCTIRAEAKKIVLSDKIFKSISDDPIDNSNDFDIQELPDSTQEVNPSPTLAPPPSPEPGQTATPTLAPTESPIIISLEPIEPQPAEDSSDVSEPDNLILALSSPIPSVEDEAASRISLTEDDPILNFARKLDGIDGLTFDKGSRNRSVYYIQSLLANLGYLSSSIDGDYGNLTKDAITAFQKDEGLTETEYADIATQFLLVARSPKREVIQNAETVVITSDNYAIILWVDGTLYVGSVESGDQLVEGTYFYPSGDYYAGGFSSGMRSGDGIAHYANGDIYVGQWSQDKMNGSGKYFFGGYYSPETYEGNWTNNKMDGSGTYTLANGTVITGTWKNNKHVSW